MHYIYKITNLLNDKVYIGQTVHPSARKTAHKNRSCNPHLRHSIAKHGWNSFQFDVIVCCKTQEDIDYTEDQLIQQYDARNEDKGYNIIPGGIGSKSGENHPRWGMKHSTESKQKMSLSANKRKASPETKRKISESNKGKIMSSEAKQLMRQNNRLLFSDEKRQQIAELYKQGQSYLTIQTTVPCSESMILKVVKENNLPHRRKK